VEAYLTGSKTGNPLAPPFSSMNSTPQPQPGGLITALDPRLQLLFNGFAEFDVVLRHVRGDLAKLEERQEAVNPNGTLFDFTPFGAL